MRLRKPDRCRSRSSFHLLNILNLDGFGGQLDGRGIEDLHGLIVHVDGPEHLLELLLRYDDGLVSREAELLCRRQRHRLLRIEHRPSGGCRRQCRLLRLLEVHGLLYHKRLLLLLLHRLEHLLLDVRRYFLGRRDDNLVVLV